MESRISKSLFKSSDLKEVQSLYCGEEKYEKEVAEWIKGDGRNPKHDCALTSMKSATNPSTVWLYRVPDGTFLGYGAIAKEEWTFRADGPTIPLTVIIWVGIDRAFHGKPVGAGRGKYSNQVMDDLLFEAMKDSLTHPVVGLFVDPNNYKAIGLYKKYEFDGDGLDPVRSQAGEIEYLRMACILDYNSLLKLVPSFSASI